jgi:hypothetical protein
MRGKEDMDQQHMPDTAWLPVARNTKAFLCLTEDDKVVDRHRKITSMYNCRKSRHTGALLKNGTIIRVTVRHITASNGKHAWLPFPTRQEDYEKTMECDRQPTRKRTARSRHWSEGRRS